MGYRERYEDDYGGHPLVATLVAAGVLLLTLGIPLHLPEHSGPGYREGYLIGQFVLGPLVLWGIAYAITIRKASPGWKIGSLVAIVLVSAAVTLARMGAPIVALEQDARGMANELQAVVDADGNVSGVPIKADAGPLTRISLTTLNGMLADMNAYGQEAKAAGLEDFTLEKPSKADPALRKCDAMAALPARAAFYKGRLEDHIAEGRAIGEAAVRKGELPRDGAEGVEEGIRGKLPAIQRRWEVFAGIARETASVCKLLRDRPWTPKRGQIFFASGRDADEFNTLIARIKAYSDEEARAHAEAKTATQRGIENLQRQH
jgi:hypothetical protein